MDTTEIEIGDLVEVIKTGHFICVLEFSSNTEVELARFLGEDGKIYSVDEVRVLPAMWTD
jgi:hypothetical protein